MRIAVVGGTGTLGRHVAEKLSHGDHEVRVLSRSSAEFPVDLTTGSGLEAGLDGCEVVVDASNNVSRRAADVLVQGSERLLAAAKNAGVRHHVGISIVGCDLVPIGYYKAKVAQEKVVTTGQVPWTLVRATQFHELIDQMFRQLARRRVLPALRIPLQTIAAVEAAAAVVDVAVAEPRRGAVDVAGPEVNSARDLAAAWRAITGSKAWMIPVVIPGPIGRALKKGSLTASSPDFRGTQTFGEWMAAQER